MRYYGYRYYRPSDARWSSRDPLDSTGVHIGGFGVFGNLSLTWMEDPRLFGSCGGFTWTTHWVLGSGSIWGYIVQEVVIDKLYYSCAGPRDGGVPRDAAHITDTYYEAWSVSNGIIYSDEQAGIGTGTDTFREPGRRGTCGVHITKRGRAVLWLGRLPDDFGRNNRDNPGAGDLLWTRRRPSFFDGSYIPAVSHWIASTGWCCCCEQQTDARLAWGF
jgi:hypothetical protein